MSTVTASNPFKTKATAGGGNYELIPAGSYPATLIGLIDLGTHDDEYKGKKTETRRISLVWELTGENKPDGNPHVIAKDFSAYFSPSSKIRKLIEGWRGKAFPEGEEFDYTVLLGKPCLVNVVHKVTSNGKAVHELAGVSGVPRGMTVPKAHYETILYVAGDGEPPDYDWLPFIYGQSIPDIIAESKEMTGQPVMTAPTSSANAPPAGPADDDIPF